MKKKKLLLLTVIIFLLFSLALPAEDTGIVNTKPVVRVETYPDTPVVGDPWRLTLLVDHAVPDEVTVISPVFAPALRIDRYLKSPRMTSTGLQTAVEYSFLPNMEDRVLIEPFTVITPLGTIETGYLVLYVLPQTQSSGADLPALTRVVWEGMPAQMTAGERAVLSLRIYQANSSQPPLQLPPQAFFNPEVPRGVILSLLPLSEQERAEGIALRFSLISLEGDFRLPARILHFENYVFEIPALNIRVTNGDMVFSENISHNLAAHERPGIIFPEESRIEENYGLVFSLRFPDYDFTVFEKSIMKPWRGQCEDIYNTARDLWDNGLYALALAELRQNERDHPAGAFLKPIRQKAEETLGIFSTNNESRWRRNLLLGISFFILFIVIIFPFVCYMFFKGSEKTGHKVFLGGKKTALICAIVISVLASFSLYRLVDSRNVFQGISRRVGIAVETAVRRLADYDGEELFFFREGQPVVIILNSDSWLYVRANDIEDKSGWVPVEKITFY